MVQQQKKNGAGEGAESPVFPACAWKTINHPVYCLNSERSCWSIREKDDTHTKPPFVFVCSLRIMALIVRGWRAERCSWSSSLYPVSPQNGDEFCTSPGIRSCFPLKIGSLQFGSRTDSGWLLLMAEHTTSTDPSKQNNLEEILSWKWSALPKFPHRLWRH